MSPIKPNLALSVVMLLTSPLVAQTAPTQTAGPYVLKYKLKVGETVTTRVVHFADTTTKVGDHEEASTSRTTSEKAWTIKSVDTKGNMTFEYRINSVNLAHKVGDSEEVKYDSKTDSEAPPVFKKVAETVAQPIGTITITPQGQIVERDKETKNPQLGMGELTVPLPADAIAIGTEWEVPREFRVKLENEEFKTIKVRELYTLEKVSAGVATIRIESQPLTPVPDPAAESQLMQQLSEGTIKFDIDNGRLLNKELNWNKEVVGFRGPNTSIKYDARFTEELLQASQRTATSTTTPTRK